MSLDNISEAVVVEVFGGGLGGGGLGLDGALGDNLCLGGGDGSCGAWVLGDDSVLGQQGRTRMRRNRGQCRESAEDNAAAARDAVECGGTVGQ